MLPHTSLRLALAALASASLAVLSGCGGYVSTYEPPDDGRARVLWRDGKPVADLGSSGVSSVCSVPGSYPYGPPPSYSGGGSNVHIHGGFWVPVFYGPRIVVVHRGVAPITPVRRVGATPVVHTSSSRSGGGGVGGLGSSGGGGGGGGGDKAYAVVLVVIALIALPFIALGLSTGRTEPEKETAQAIDDVNAANDATRGSPSCAPLVLGAAPQ